MPGPRRRAADNAGPRGVISDLHRYLQKCGLRRLRGRTTRPITTRPSTMTSTHHDDHYAILGVDPDATDAQITHAYRALLRRHHPDTRVSTNGEEAATDDTRLRHVLAAYTVLHDPQQRADYDRRRRPPAPQRGRTRATPGGSTVILGTITTTRPTGLTPVESADTPPMAATMLDLLRAIFEPPC